MTIRTADAEGFVAEARARAGRIVETLLTEPRGPTMALLILHIARAEIVRIARQRIPGEHWKLLLRELAGLESRFDRQAAAINATSARIVEIAGVGGAPVGEPGGKAS